MSTHEVKQEHKNTEGDAHAKAKRKAEHRRNVSQGAGLEQTCARETWSQTRGPSLQSMGSLIRERQRVPARARLSPCSRLLAPASPRTSAARPGHRRR